MTRKFIDQKYYLSSPKKDVNTYVKGCNICLLSKMVKYKLYNNRQALPISIC